jgi:cobalt-precorrin-5B (C1)-methyltransferase
MVRFLKYGITTGATAAAAAKAAAITALKEPITCVVIPTPIGLRFEIAVKSSRKLSKDTAEAIVIKDAGQDIDATDKMEIIATVKIIDNEKILVNSGVGVGIVTKPGLQVPIGEGAINPVPKMMIIDAVKEALPQGKGAEITISAPDGANIAKKTTNAKLGIKNGVSILGTTGVVKPLSLEACRRSLVPQIDVALAHGFKRLVYVPGNIGEKIAKENFHIPEDAIIQTGDFVGYMLDKAIEKNIKEIIFIGHSGKIVKLAANIFNTHHKVGDARNEVIASYAGAVGAPTQIINQILAANTSDEASKILQPTGFLEKTYDRIAMRVNQRISDRVDNKLRISIIIVAMDGKVLGMDKNAKENTPWSNLT